VSIVLVEREAIESRRTEIAIGFSPIEDTGTSKRDEIRHTIHVVGCLDHFLKNCFEFRAMRGFWRIGDDEVHEMAHAR
jgi:hypothetical protein